MVMDDYPAWMRAWSFPIVVTMPARGPWTRLRLGAVLGGRRILSSSRGVIHPTPSRVRWWRGNFRAAIGAELQTETCFASGDRNASPPLALGPTKAFRFTKLIGACANAVALRQREQWQYRKRSEWHLDFILHRFVKDSFHARSWVPLLFRIKHCGQECWRSSRSRF